MTARSTLQPRAGVRYSELDGEAVLYEPISHVVHRLSPAAAAVWLRFDGRPLGPDPDAVDDPTATIELARRLRSLGLADDADPAGPTAPSPPPDGPAEPGIVDLPGRLVTHDATLTLVLDAHHDGPAVAIDTTTLVPVAGETPVDGVLVVDPAEPHARPLAGVDALRAIVAQLPAAWFTPDDALDRLADLVDGADIATGPPPAP